jgi:hypothetical protein
MAGKKKAPNSGEGWALLRFHAAPGGKPVQRDQGLRLDGGALPMVTGTQPLNDQKIPLAPKNATQKTVINSLTVTNTPQVRCAIEKFPYKQ